VAGVLIQYPRYAGMVKMMTESGLAKKMAEFFIDVSTSHTFPLLVGVYSAFLGLFIPSAGGKWLVEAPYMLTAANSLHVHLGWVVQTYNATEALANLIHPFWMLPLWGSSRPQACDIVGARCAKPSPALRWCCSSDSQLHPATRPRFPIADAVAEIHRVATAGDLHLSVVGDGRCRLAAASERGRLRCR
jgi:hypothetical protein